MKANELAISETVETPSIAQKLPASAYAKEGFYSFTELPMLRLNTIETPMYLPNNIDSSRYPSAVKVFCGSKWTHA